MKYAFISKDETNNVFTLSIGKTVPGLASFGCAMDVGMFNSLESAKTYAIERGVSPERIY